MAFFSPLGLFGGGFEEDPFASTRNLFGQMDRMMGAMMRDPFGEDPFFRGSGFPALMDSGRRSDPFQLAPFGMMSSMENMMKEGSCHSYSSSSVMTMTTGPDGRPQAQKMQKTDGKSYNWRESGSRAMQIGIGGGLGNNFNVYQASSSTHSTPGGVRETQRSMADSRTGMRKMAIGHHIDDRSHVIEKELKDGELEERQEFVNLEEEEAANFDHEFKRKTQQALGAIEHRPRHRQTSPSRQRSTYLPALPSSSSYRRRSRPVLSISAGSSRANDNRVRNRERGVGRTRPYNPNH